ncbi:mechanosensitive ion channel family protein [Parachitinimonas caeni]|uniref:Mechanosensitive ion channel family protein n=1 Tax=Parachitinimonas caeni TaxID=3031301 RepID=A0ABT7DYS1_9NEIS|nr:mechanosensitive ion channel family protein [Parachitinimonas caeni]MDK2125159.1 mechanosensitive ion channel family protein [Parachitinimonas caeni]
MINFALISRSLALDLIATVCLVLLIVGVRHWAVRAISTNEALNLETRRRWRVDLRNGLLLLFLSGILLIWGPELRSAMVSLLAVAAAIVLATKELILCFSGSVYRGGGNAYAIGDRIEVGGYRGTVIDINWFSTTLIEYSPAGKGAPLMTGRAVIFPNSLLLTQPVFKESFMGEFTVHNITIPLCADTDWQRAEAILLEIANAICEPWLESARQHLRALTERSWFDTPSPEPRVSVLIPEAGKIHLQLRLPIQLNERNEVEQKIVREFLMRSPIKAFTCPDPAKT